MSFEIIQHKADIGLEIKNDSLEGLFSDALKGMAHILKSEISLGGELKHLIIVESVDLTSLLVDFLNEVLAYSAVDKVVYNKLHIRKITDNFIEAEIIGNKIESFDEDIKAVTYYRANVINKNGEWQTDLIFDI